MASKTQQGIFSPNLGGIEEAAPSRGGAYVQAAQTSGAAKVAEAKTTAGVIEFLGTNAIEAYKGKLSADFETKIKDSLDHLEGYGEKAKVASKNLDYLNSNEFAANSAIQLEQLNQQTAEFGADDPTVKDFRKTIDAYGNAQAQGVLSKQDVLNRIAATVKEYTAKAPGWGSTFRQLAAEMTGISNADTYGLHKILTAADKENEVAKLQAKQVQEFVKEVGDYYGVDVNHVTPTMRLEYSQAKQIEALKKNAENKLAISDATDKEKDKYFGQYVGALQLQGIASISSAFNKFREKNAGVDITSKDAQAQIGGQVAGLLNDIEDVLVKNIRGKTVIGPDNPSPISYDTTEKYVKSTKEFIKTYKDNLQTENGWNAFTLSVQSAEGDYNKMINNLMTANPYVALLAKTGALPELTKLYLVLNGDKEKMSASVGPKAAEAMDTFMKSGGIGASIMSNSAAHPSAEAATQAVGPEATKLLWLNANHTVDEYSNKQSLNEGEQVNAVKEIKTIGNMFTPTDSGAMNDLNSKIKSGALLSLSKKLTASQNVEAFSPMRDKAQTTAVQILDQISKYVEDSGASITIDPNTNRFSVTNKPSTSTNAPKGLMSMVPNTVETLSRQVNNLNSVGALLDQLKTIIPDVAGSDNLATTYKNYINSKISTLEKEKAGLEQVQKDRQAERRKSHQGGLSVQDQAVNEDIKDADRKIKVWQDSLIATGEPIVKKADVPVPKNTDLSNTPDAKALKKANADEFSGQDNVDHALTANNPDGTPMSPVDIVKNLEGIINEAERGLTGKNLTEEDKAIIAKEKRKAQLARIELIHGMTLEQKKQLYGVDIKE